VGALPTDTTLKQADRQLESKGERKMIVKYLNEKKWGYIDNVRQAGSIDVDIRQSILDYDAEKYRINQEGEENGWPIPQDMCEYAEGVKLPEHIIASNKAFTRATENCKEWGDNVHCVNMIDGKKWEYPAAVIIMHIDDKEHREFDTIALVTNETVYLMNDKGQTIERLV
jgi:hypothetical protein